MKICSDCKKEMQFHAKGVGKTKESFWGCSDYPKCKNTANPTQEEIKKYELQARIDAMDADFTKFKSMARMNATNNAVDILGKVLEIENKMSRNNQEIVVSGWTGWLYEQHMEWWIKNIINEED